MSDIDKIHTSASTATASTSTQVSRIGTELKESTESTESILQPKYINRGTYGCIYQPMIPCANQHAKPSSIHYISKISKKTDSEERIGHLVRQIPQYQYYFAPIIDSCPINFNEINEREIKKCDIVDEVNKTQDNGLPEEYKSYKIRYVGKYHVAKYIQLLSDIPSNQDLTLQLKHCVELHIHLLKALKKLGDARIVHYDLKSNNIILDDRYHRPVIIDFGISFETSDLDTFDYTKYKKIFYSDYNVYPPWCIEIVLLSYIILNVPALYDVTDPALIPDVFDKTITGIEMKHIEDAYVRFLEDNHVYTTTESYMNMNTSEPAAGPTTGPTPSGSTSGTTEETWNQTKKEKMREILLPYQDKTWKDLIQKLTANVQSWDNYSLAVIMKELVSYSYKKYPPTDIPNDLRDSFSRRKVSPAFDALATATFPPSFSSIVHEYTNMLVQIIVSEPDTRPTAETTLRTIIEWVRGLQAFAQGPNVPQKSRSDFKVGSDFVAS